MVTAEIDINDIDEWIRKEKGLFCKRIEIKLNETNIAVFTRKNLDGDEFDYTGIKL